MATQYTSSTHVFSLDDLTHAFDGTSYADDPSNVDSTAAVVEQYVDKDGNVLSAVDSEFGFHVTDFIGAEQKELDGDFAEGWAGNIFSDTDPAEVVGLAVRNAPTDVFKTGLPLGTWSLGLGSGIVKASTEHYETMAALLSDQKYPDDPDALGALDNDLRLLDLDIVNDTIEVGPTHLLYVDELSEAMQRAIDNVEAGTNPVAYSDIDFDRDGTADPFTTRTVTIDYDLDGDGTPEAVDVGGVDLGSDGTVDLVDNPLNGLGGTADLTDLLEPNESSVLHDIAFSTDYSITLKDDGKLLYRWGTAVKRPNDVRMEVDIELPSEWTEDSDSNDVADILEDGHAGYLIESAQLVVNHTITNNPNDQIRPEDYENEGAIGRLPSYYIVQDPDDPSNILWVSPRDSYNAIGDSLPSYFKLTDTGEIDMAAGGIAVYDPDGVLVGYRNTDENDDPIGTVLRDMSLAETNAAADLNFTSSDLANGYTEHWYTTVDREPFEWSYDKYSDDPYKQDFESFRSPDEAAAEGYTADELVSGPRWRLTPNKFGQDLPGLEVPLNENTQPPYQRDNIKYVTGEETTTIINLLDWGADEDGDGIVDPSPLAHSSGWMVIDPGRIDENKDGLIDEGWSAVNGTLEAGDAMPTEMILSAVSPNGVVMDQMYLDTAVYIKGDRQDDAQLYDMYLEIEYVEGFMGAAQQVEDLNHIKQTVAYVDGYAFDNPVVFATPATQNGAQIASVMIHDVTSTDVRLSVEEPNYLDGKHVPEDVSLLTFEEGLWELMDGTMMEVGTVEVESGATNDFDTVAFSQEFDEVPVVLAQLQTSNGDEWLVVRTDDITTTGFEFAIQEEEAGDGFHEDQLLGWVAVDASSPTGVIDTGNLIAQAFNEDRAVNGADTFEFTFDEALGVDPIVSSAISSFDGRDPVTLRLAGLIDDGTTATAEFAMQEEKSLDDETAHRLEDIAGLAFDGTGLFQAYDVVMDIA